MYAVLGVPDSATQEEIEAAYQRKVREVHPDAGGSADAFCAVQEAYRALTDPHVPMRRRLGAEQEESKTLVLQRPDGSTETQQLWLRAQPDGQVRILTTTSATAPTAHPLQSWSQSSGTADAGSGCPAAAPGAPACRCETGSGARPDAVLGQWSPLPTE